MKPHRIILIRHGECHANTDESKFATEPDYTIELTEKGVAQAVKPDKVEGTGGRNPCIFMSLAFGVLVPQR